MLALDLSFYIKYVELMVKIVRIFLLKLAQNHGFTHHVLAAITSFANIDGHVTFLIYDLVC